MLGAILGLPILALVVIVVCFIFAILLIRLIFGTVGFLLKFGLFLLFCYIVIKVVL